MCAPPHTLAHTQNKYNVTRTAARTTKKGVGLDLDLGGVRRRSVGVNKNKMHNIHVRHSQNKQKYCIIKKKFKRELEMWLSG